MKALLKLALRSLLVRRVNLLIGAFVVLGTLLLVVGGTVLSNIERSMSLSIVETMTGHVLVWSKSGPRPVDPLVLFSTDGTPRLEPIPDFPEVERALLELPGVRAVVPLGFSNASFRDRNLMDRLVEQMREALHRSRSGPDEERAAAKAELEELGAHAVQVAARLRDELIQSQAAVDLGLLEEDLAALERVTAEAFWAELEAEPEAALEFLENRIAPQLDGQGEIDIFHIGADLEVFRKNFQRLQLVEGELVPPGERGLLLSALLYETAFKLPLARRLDQVKAALEGGQTLAEAPELQEWLREAQGLVPALTPRAGPKAEARGPQTRLAAALGAESTADVGTLLRSLLAMDDANFEQRYALFYRDVAPFVQLYRARIGDLVPLRSEVPGGYPRSSLVRLYGTVEFRGLEKSDVAAVSLLDPSTFAELYGHFTPGERFEVEQMRRTAGVVELSREEAEAQAFAAPIADLESPGLRGADCWRCRDASAAVGSPSQRDAGAGRRRSHQSDRGAVPGRSRADGCHHRAGEVPEDEVGGGAGRGALGSGGRRPEPGHEPRARPPVCGRVGHLPGHRPHHQQLHDDGDVPPLAGDRDAAGDWRAAWLRGRAGADRDAARRVVRRRSGCAAGRVDPLLAGIVGHPGRRRTPLLPLLRSAALPGGGAEALPDAAPAGHGRLHGGHPDAGTDGGAGDTHPRHAERGGGLMILRIAARNLLQHGRRSALVGLAIALVTGLAVLLLGLAHGVQQNLYRASTTLLAGEVNVGGLFKPSLGRAAPLIVDAGPLVEQIRQALPSAEYVATRLVSDARISGPSESLLPVTTVIGLDVDAEPALSGALQLEAGTLSALSGPGTILLFRNQADRLGVTIGDRVTLSGRTLRGAHNALDVRVVAIAAGGGIAAAPRVFVPLEVLQRLHLYRQDAISAVQIHLAPGSTPETIEAAEVQARAALAASGAVLLERQVRSFGEMRAAVEQEPWTGQRLYVSSWDEEFEFVSESWGLMSVLITLVTALLLAIVSAGLMNMLYVSVRERTRELGTLRAIGMSRLADPGDVPDRGVPPGARRRFGRRHLGLARRAADARNEDRGT